MLERSFPILLAASSWVSSKRSINALKPFPFSIGFRSSRCKFSTKASVSISSSEALRSTTGTAANPTISAARNRRSPAITSYPSPARRTTRGCKTPTSRTDSTSSAISRSSKPLRGCIGFGLIAPIGTSLTPPTAPAVGSLSSSAPPSSDSSPLPNRRSVATSSLPKNVLDSHSSSIPRPYVYLTTPQDASRLPRRARPATPLRSYSCSRHISCHNSVAPPTRCNSNSVGHA